MLRRMIVAALVPALKFAALTATAALLDRNLNADGSQTVKQRIDDGQTAQG